MAVLDWWIIFLLRPLSHGHYFLQLLVFCYHLMPQWASFGSKHGVIHDRPLAHSLINPCDHTYTYCHQYSTSNSWKQDANKHFSCDKALFCAYTVYLSTISLIESLDMLQWREHIPHNLIQPFINIVIFKYIYLGQGVVYVDGTVTLKSPGTTLQEMV